MESNLNSRMEKFLSIAPEGFPAEEFMKKFPKFFTAPASINYHQNYCGGLFEHSLGVYQLLKYLTNKGIISWEREESPFIVGMFHDLCKVDQYEEDHEGYTYSENMLFTGHGEKSVVLLSTILRLTEEEAACIVYHMGAFTDSKQWDQYTNAVKRYPNILWTHHADMYDAHVKGD